MSHLTHTLLGSGYLAPPVLGHSGFVAPHSGFVGPHSGFVAPLVNPYVDVHTTLTAQNADLTASLHGSNVELSAVQARCAQLEQANAALTDQVTYLNGTVADLTA